MLNKMQPNQLNCSLKVITRAFLMLTLAGVFIGIMHENDLFITIFLSFFLIYLLIQNKNYQSQSILNKRFFWLGIFLTITFGSFTEIWGIHYQLWQYHDLDNFREFPLWLPLAWGLSFLFIFRFKNRLCVIFNIPTNKIWPLFKLNIAISLIFPTLGEMVAIKLNVWHYNLPYQVFGVPVIAIFFLTYIHAFIFLLSYQFAYRK